MKINKIYSKSLSFIVVSLAFLTLFSCSKDDSREGVLTQEQMVPIFLDIYIAEGKVNELHVKRDSALRIFEAYEQHIFDEHGISDSVYTHSLQYYYDHPDELEKIYETVLDSLNLMEKRLDESKEEEEKNEDSPKSDSTQVDKTDSVKVKLEKEVAA